LSKNINKSVSRQDMLDEVWGYASTVETHTLETHIYRLRQKLKNEFGLDDFLVTNDEGYILNF
jgi:DNA-binding response OmpR family regulator